MADESLWQARLRWRWRGALLWPLFVLLTVGDALLLGQLPISGDDGTAFVPALLLAGFFNLLVVAVIGPLASLPLRKRRPDLPGFVAQDYTGSAGLFLVTLALLAGGLIHRPRMNEARDDLVAQLAAARDLIELRTTAPDVPVVVVSSATGRRPVDKALRNGAAGYVYADEVEQTLPAAVSAALSGLVAVPAELRRHAMAPTFSHRERQVLALAVRGYTNTQIAAELFLAESTVKSHLSACFRKLGVSSRAEAAEALAAH